MQNERAVDYLTEDEIANDLYTKYCVAVGGKAYNGDSLPTWREFRDNPLKNKQSEGWIVVAKAAIELAHG